MLRLRRIDVVVERVLLRVEQMVVVVLRLLLVVVLLRRRQRERCLVMVVVVNGLVRVRARKGRIGRVQHGGRGAGRRLARLGAADDLNEPSDADEQAAVRARC